MQITEIEFSGYEYRAEDTRHTANVGLTIADRFITLLCSVKLGGEASARVRAEALLGEAIRQLRRMPEFRAGGATVELAGGLTAGPLPQFA